MCLSTFPSCSCRACLWLSRALVTHLSSGACWGTNSLQLQIRAINLLPATSYWHLHHLYICSRALGSWDLLSLVEVPGSWETTWSQGYTNDNMLVPNCSRWTCSCWNYLENNLIFFQRAMCITDTIHKYQLRLIMKRALHSILFHFETLCLKSSTSWLWEHSLCPIIRFLLRVVYQLCFPGNHAGEKGET